MLPNDTLLTILEVVVTSPREAVLMRVCRVWCSMVRTLCTRRRMRMGMSISLADPSILRPWQLEALKMMNSLAGEIGEPQCLWICSIQGGMGLTYLHEFLERRLGRRFIRVPYELGEVCTRYVFLHVKEMVLSRLRDGFIPILSIDVTYASCALDNYNEKYMTALANLLRLLHRFRLPRLLCSVPVIITAHNAPIYTSEVFPDGYCRGFECKVMLKDDNGLLSVPSFMMK